MAAYVEGEWVAGDSYNLQNERGTTFVFTEIEGVLQVSCGQAMWGSTASIPTNNIGVVFSVQCYPLNNQ